MLIPDFVYGQKLKNCCKKEQLIIFLCEQTVIKKTFGLTHEDGDRKIKYNRELDKASAAAAEVRTRNGPELRRENDYHKDNSKANQEGEDRQTDWPTCSRVGRNAHMRRVVKTKNMFISEFGK